MLSAFRRKFYSHLPLSFFPYLLPRDVVGVFYHAVSDEPMPHVQHLYPPISTTVFEDSLIYLKKHFNLVDTNQIFDYWKHSKPLPKKAAFISFDDGFIECYSIVRPLLLKYDVPCAFFLPTDFIDNQKMLFLGKASMAMDMLVSSSPEQSKQLLAKLKESLGISLGSPAEFKQWFDQLKKREHEKLIDQVCEIFGVNVQAFLDQQKPFLTRAQIQEMVAEGFIFGSHTCSHIKLNQVSVEEMEQEIVQSTRSVREITGQERIPFSFPFSAQGIDREVLENIRNKHDDIFGLFYNTAGLEQDADFIVNRMWAEGKGLKPENGKTNLPKLIRQSYRNAIYLERKNRQQ